MSSKGFIELLRLSERGKQRQSGRKDTESTWSGVAFKLGEFNFIAPLGEVLEVVNPLAMTQVPKVKPWMKGLTNLRGRLLPVTDLGQFAGMESSAIKQDSAKIIVVSHDELYTGLMVDRVFGIQHFSPEQFSGTSVQVQPSLDVYLQGYFYDARKDDVWHVFLLSKLIEQSEFLNAAV